MTNDEYQRLTPREFAALAERQRAEERRADYRTASLICMIYNVNRGPKNKALEPADLFREKTDRTVQTPEQQVQFARILNAMMGGETVEVV